MNSAQAAEMAAAAGTAGRLLMEAAMYRFQPRMLELAEALRGQVRYLHASFAFAIDAPDNYRMRPEMGGGALLDIGFYVVDVARWLLGEPDRVEAVSHEDGVDMSWTVALGFPDDGLASLFASFETPEYQELVAVTGERVVRVERPFFGRPGDPDPYRLMAEAFAEAALSGAPAPVPPANSIATARVLDSIRDQAVIRARS
jgi:predicted dehydrogenase